MLGTVSIVIYSVRPFEIGRCSLITFLKEVGLPKTTEIGHRRIGPRGYSTPRRNQTKISGGAQHDGLFFGYRLAVLGKA